MILPVQRIFYTYPFSHTLPFIVPDIKSLNITGFSINDGLEVFPVSIHFWNVTAKANCWASLAFALQVCNFCAWSNELSLSISEALQLLFAGTIFYKIHIQIPPLSG